MMEQAIDSSLIHREELQHSPCPRAHHQSNILLRGELQREPGVTRVTRRNLGTFPITLQAVVVRFTLGQDVAALRIAQYVPRLDARRRLTIGVSFAPSPWTTGSGGGSP